METLHLIHLLFVVFLIGLVQGQVTIVDPEGNVLTASEGESAMFKCISTDDQDIEWVYSSVFGDITLEEEGSIVFNQALINGKTNSFLTVEGVIADDEGSYFCRGTRDGSQSRKVRLIVSASLPEEWSTPNIERRSDTQTQIEIEIGRELRLKCTGGTVGSALEFQQNGQRISTDTKNFMTESEDESGQHILILTRKFAEVGHSGSYSCRDAAYPEISAFDSIEVVVTSQPTVLLEIIEPASSIFKTMVGDEFTIKCQAGSSVPIQWLFNENTEIQNEMDGFIVTEKIDAGTQIKTVILTKEETSQNDEGDYSCVNGDNLDERASVQLDVRIPGEEDDDNGDEDDDDDGILDGLFGSATNTVPSMVVAIVLSFGALLWF